MGAWAVRTNTGGEGISQSAIVLDALERMSNHNNKYVVGKNINCTENYNNHKNVESNDLDTVNNEIANYDGTEQNHKGGKIHHELETQNVEKVLHVSIPSDKTKKPMKDQRKEDTFIGDGHRTLNVQVVSQVEEDDEDEDEDEKESFIRTI